MCKAHRQHRAAVNIHAMADLRKTAERVEGWEEGRSKEQISDKES